MKYFIFILLTFSIVCCKQTSEVRFLEPQPFAKKNLNEIPKEYRGKYLSKTDSSTLTIDSKMILQEKFWLSKTSLKEMQQELDTAIQDDTQFQFSSNWIMSIKILDDSALISSYLVDTVFQISESQLIRSFKGYLFLNAKDADSIWRVNTLKLENGLLDISPLVNVSQIDTLKSVTEIAASEDSTSIRVNQIVLNPKRKELKEILKQKDTNGTYIKL